MYITINNTDYYAYTGTHKPDEGRETVVFLHGASMDHTVWSHQSRYFAYHGYNVAALDLPGHKFSKGALLSRVEDMAQWLNAVIGIIPSTGIHLVGHSMGSLVALQAAADFNHAGQKLKTLSLVGFSYPMSVTPQLMDAARNNPEQAYSMMTQWSHTSRIGGEPVPGFWSAGMQMSMMRNSPKGSIHCNLQACDNYQGGEAAFEKVTCPILFISGQRDKMAPARLAKIEADRNELAEIIMLPDCGHNIMSESPDGVLNALTRFIGNHAVQT